MLFNSFEFIFIFLPIVFLIYFLLNKKKQTIASKVWLVFSSLFFYSWWNIAYLPLILVSMITNYSIGFYIHARRPGKKKLLLVIGLIFNIGLLGYFKYYDFFAENLNQLLSTNLVLQNLALPLAIIFLPFNRLRIWSMCIMRKPSSRVY